MKEERYFNGKFYSKNYFDHRKHFIERANERLNFNLTDIEYDNLCSNPIFGGGGVKINQNKTFIGITINNKKYWALWNRGYHCLETIYDTDYNKSQKNIDMLLTVVYSKKKVQFAFNAKEHLIQTVMSIVRNDLPINVAITEYMIKSPEHFPIIAEYHTKGEIKAINLLKHILRLTGGVRCKKQSLNLNLL